MPEFEGLRARLYEESLRLFPRARAADIRAMHRYLRPRPGESILELGVGTGLFTSHLAAAVGERGRVCAVDPSPELLRSVRKIKSGNIRVIESSAESLRRKTKGMKFDAVWSFGAVHHIPGKVALFQNLARLLKPGGRIVIADVFTGSALARHFDDKVALYCITGHEVSYLSREYGRTACRLAGLGAPRYHDLSLQWVFDSRKEIGIFVQKLHAMTRATPLQCLRGAEEILGVRTKGTKHYLNWPMTFLVAAKGGRS